MFVHQTIKELQRKKVHAIFIKLDISKPFDTVNWSYLLDIMTFLGFGLRWRNWISALWATSSSTFLVNGEPRKRIYHKWGVRQGDPLSPMLFLLVIEPLHMLFQHAQATGALIFLLNLTSQDMHTTKHILSIFGEALGLITNLEKTELYPINCQDTNLDQVLDASLQATSFPCTYLGLSLHYKKLPKSMIRPIV
jgi:hypothetical protein